MIERLAGYGARAAIVSGALSALGTVLLLLTYLSALTSEQFHPAPLLARAAFAVYSLAALTAIPLAARLNRSWRLHAARHSAVVYALAVASLGVLGLDELAYAADVVPLSAISLISIAASVGKGLWLVAVSARQASVAISGTQRSMGVAIGIAYVWALPTFVVSGPQTDSFVPVPLALVMLVGGLLAFLLANFAYPVWIIRLGRALLHTED